MTPAYLLRRIGSVLLVLVVVSFTVFAITMILPGNAAVMILGEYATEDQLAALERRLGLDQPLLVQYLEWSGGLLRGDFGMSLRLNQPVSGLILDAVGNSALLGLSALVIVVLVAVPLGMLAALRRGTRTDLGIGLMAYMGSAMPEFVTATLLLVLFAGPVLAILPAGGFTPPGESLSGFLAHVVLPAVTLSLIMTAHIARMVRSELADVMASDYVRAARLKGLREDVVVRRHALPNSLAPTVAVVSLNFGYLLGGIIVVEEIFAWPGLGRLMIYALENRDLPVIQAVTLTLAMVYALSNLLSDIVIAALDPRVRYE